MKLYAIKCRGGYVKNDTEKGYICVDLRKATVYDKVDLNRLNEVINCARDKGITDIKIVELTITERDYN